TISALNAVGDENAAVFFTESADGLKEGRGRLMDTADALDPFDDDGRHLVAVGLKTGFERGFVIKGQEDHILRLVDGGDDGRVVRHGYRQRRAAMEGLAEGDYLFAAGMKGGQLECVLVCFGPGITKKYLVVRAAADLAELIGQLFLQGNADRIAIETDLIQLVGDALYVMRMGMADGNDGMAAIEIQILLTILIPDVGTFCLYYGDIIDRIDVE